MGWTSYPATHYKNGKVDRVAEVIDNLTWKSEHRSCTVVKAVTAGSTVYAAVECKSPEKTFVFAVVVLTHVTNDYYNFAYKEIEEGSGPVESQCPVSILKLLSPIEEIYEEGSSARDWASAWRQRCHENNAAKLTKKKDPDALGNLPVGTCIRWKYYDVSGNMNELTLVKRFHPARRSPIWMTDRGSYVPQTRIKTYTIVSRPYKDEKSKARVDEALKRLNILETEFRFNPNVAKDFSEGKLNVSDPNGMLFWLSDKYSEALVKKVAELEGSGKTVYHILDSQTEIGRMFSILYVSDHPTEWDDDKECLKNGNPCVYVFNADYPELSEYGYIEFNGKFGGLVRTA